MRRRQVVHEPLTTADVARLLGPTEHRPRDVPAGPLLPPGLGLSAWVIRVAWWAIALFLVAQSVLTVVEMARAREWRDGLEVALLFAPMCLTLLWLALGSGKRWRVDADEHGLLVRNARGHCRRILWSAVRGARTDRGRCAFDALWVTWRDGLRFGQVVFPHDDDRAVAIKAVVDRIVAARERGTLSLEVGDGGIPDTALSLAEPAPEPADASLSLTPRS